MKRTVIIAAFVAAFGATFAQAQTCVTSANGLTASCTDDNGAIVNAPDERPVYPTGEMPRDSDTVALADKVNYLDVSDAAAHDRLNHAEDRLDAHKKSIGNLYATKVDTATFEADQKRQDDQVNKVGQVAQSAQANSNTAIVAAGQANRNSTEANANAKAASASASEAKIDAKSAQSTAKNAYNIGISATTYAAEANENAGIAMNDASNAQNTANHAVSETEKLWADKASVANVDELRAAHTEEVAERIKNDAAESQERIANDAAESKERIAGDQRNAAETARLDAVKADRAELAELNRASNETSRSYAQQAEKNANAYTDAKFSQMERKVDNVKREGRAGVAAAAAMANIPTAQEIGRLTVGAGAGFYKDQQAVAVGGSYRFDSRVTLKGSVSTTGRDTAAGVGASWAL